MPRDGCPGGSSHSALRSGLAVPAQELPEVADRLRYHSEHEQEGQLSGQCCDGKFLRTAEERIALSPEFRFNGTLQERTHRLSGLLQ